MLAGCEPARQTKASSVADETAAPRLCGDAGHVRASLYGAISARLDWNAEELECSGMPRPEGHGARLRFAGQLNDDDRRIAIIIAIPELQHAGIGNEYASNVTLIEEGGGRFFSTSDLSNCLTDITLLSALDESGDRFSVSGTLYCVTPLPEVNGKSSVSIPELRFSGLIDWSAS